MSSDQYSVIDSVIASNDSCFLATIVHVEGSSYRKVGTMMFISEQGIESGLLSGGCVEQDLLARIDLLSEKRAFLMVYDLRSEDDLSWGQGIGCDGRLHILVEPTNSELRQNYTWLKEQLEKGLLVKHSKRFDKHYHNVKSYFITENGETFGSLRNAEDMYNDELGVVKWHETLDYYFFIQTINPPSRLIIYGAGPDVAPIVSYASQVGFNVILSDWRPALCTRENIPFAKKYIVGSPLQVMNIVKPTKQDYCLIMSHSFMKDQELVNYLLDRPLKYLGILGSKKRTKKLLVNKTIPSWVSYPVGLPIYSESPEEIAISIIAELIRVKNQKMKVYQ